MGKRPVYRDPELIARRKQDFFKPIVPRKPSDAPRPAKPIPAPPVVDKPAADNQAAEKPPENAPADTPPPQWTTETVPYTALTKQRVAPDFEADTTEHKALFRATFPHGKTLATAIVSQSDLGTEYYFDYCEETGLTISIQKHEGSALVVFKFPRSSFIHWSGSKRAVSFCFTKANVSKLNTWCKNDPTFTVEQYSDKPDITVFRLHIPGKRDGVFFLHNYDRENGMQEIIDVPSNLVYATSCTLSLLDFTDALRDSIVANGITVGLRIRENGLNMQAYQSLSEGSPLTLITLACGLRMTEEIEELCFSIVFLELFCRLHSSVLNASISLDPQHPLRLHATIKAPAANSPAVELGTVTAYMGSQYRE